MASSGEYVIAGQSSRPGPLSLLAAVRPAESRATLLSFAVVFLAWAGAVAIGIHFHEFWRDEVRALSVALGAPTLWAIPASLHGEGHPSLWYLMLRAAYDVFGTKAVLPGVSAAVAAAAVALFLWSAPFPLWWKALFVFSGIPLYEYSVMARNYGIAMLLMFLFALVYGQARRRPILLGVILALLAQTNVHSALLVPLYGFLWVCDWLADRKRGAPGVETAWALFFGIAVAGAGLLAAFLTVYPPPDNLMTRFIGTTDPLHALREALLDPGQFYQRIGRLPRFPSVTATILLYLSVVGLASRPALLLSALGGLWGTSLFFILVYPATGYRHQAIWFVFLLSLYWIKLARGPAPRRSVGRVRQDFGANPETRLERDFFRFSFYAVVPIMLLINCAYGFRDLYWDIVQPLSESRAAGEALKREPGLAAAIVVPEPEHIGEALPYYAENEIYLARERRFGKLSAWPKNALRELTLGNLLRTAQMLRSQTGRPVVMLIEYPVSPDNIGETFDSTNLGWRFSYTAAELSEFRNATHELPLTGHGRYEDFRAYVLN